MSSAALRLSFLSAPPAPRLLSPSRLPVSVPPRRASAAACCASAPPARAPSSSLGNLRHSRALLRAVWAGAVARGGVAIDATCGRGNDAYSLALLAGRGGLVHALDIQRDAVAQTVARFAEAAEGEVARVCGAVRSHESFDGLERVGEGRVSAVVYNLGWFPGSGADRSVVTEAETTVRSLREAERLVAVGGVITVTGYFEQKGGEEEVAAVQEWAKGLNSKEWSVSMVNYVNRDKAPVVLVCERV